MVGFKTELFQDDHDANKPPKREKSRARRALSSMGSMGRSMSSLLSPGSKGSKGSLLKRMGSSFRAKKDERSADAKECVAKLTRKQLEALVLRKIGEGAITIQEVGGRACSPGSLPKRRCDRTRSFRSRSSGA